MKSMTKNFCYNLFYQVFSLLTPLLVNPYLTRVLSKEELGLNSIINSQVMYFSLLGSLGISYLGIRTISNYNKKYNENLVLDFWKLYTLQFTLFLFVSILYGFFINAFKHETILYYFYYIYVFSMMFDITWFFQGLEEFRLVSIRNIIVRILSTMLVFIFVKQQNDIIVYVICLYLPQLLLNFILFVTALKKYLNFNIKIIYSFDIFKKSILLAIPTLAISSYTVFDKIILGYYTGVEQVAIYEQGQILIRILLAIIGAWGTASLPKVSNVNESKKKHYIDGLVLKSSKAVWFISNALFWGFLSICNLFVDFYYPSEYFDVLNVLYICSALILIVSCENLFGIQVLLARGYDKEYTISLVVAAIVNVFLNITFIPRYGILAACFTTVLSELLALVIQVLYSMKEIDVIKILKQSYPFFIIGTIMFIQLKFFQLIFENGFYLLLISCLYGALFYIIFSYKYLAIINIHK